MKTKISIETTLLLFRHFRAMCKITFGSGLCYTQNSEIQASLGAKVVSSDQHVFSPNFRSSHFQETFFAFFVDKSMRNFSFQNFNTRMENLLGTN